MILLSKVLDFHPLPRGKAEYSLDLTCIRRFIECGSCWTFQTVAIIESHTILSGQRAVILSEQELVDCDKLDKSDGCNGGWPNVGLV